MYICIDVMKYLRHLNMETRFECQKHLKAEDYKTNTNDMPLLLKELIDLTLKVNKYKESLIKYYAEWLSQLDANAIENIHSQLQDVLQNSEGLNDAMKGLIKDLRVLRADDFIGSNKGNI